LMVAKTFGWDNLYMATHFGWRAAIAVVLNAAALTWLCRGHLLSGDIGAPAADDESAGTSALAPVPWGVILIHVAFLAGIVAGAHHPTVFLAPLMLFIGYAGAYRRYQNTLLVREGLMV